MDLFPYQGHAIRPKVTKLVCLIETSCWGWGLITALTVIVALTYFLLFIVRRKVDKNRGETEAGLPREDCGLTIPLVF